MAETPEEHIARLDEPRRGEIQRLHELIRAAAPELEVEAGPQAIGYGPYHYRYASGREGDSYTIGLASRKQYISLYVMCSDAGEYIAQRYKERLPKANIGKACVRFRHTADVDLDAIRDMVAEAARIGPPDLAH